MSNTLNNAPPADEWWYTQIYLQPAVALAPNKLSAIGDQLLAELGRCVETYRQAGWFRRFFFIRYGEGGYHIRLRFAGETELLYGPLQSHLEQQLATFFAQHPELFLPETQPVTPAALWQSRRLRHAVYEPEYVKYGGPWGVRLAEEHFEHSSSLCFRILAAERQSAIGRSQFALELITILLSTSGYTLEEKLCILKSYTCYWLGITADAEDVARSLETNYQRLKSSLFRRFDADLIGTLERGWADKSLDIFPSWRRHISAHMERLKAAERNGLLQSPLPAFPTQDAMARAAYPNIAETPVTTLLIAPNYLHLLNNRLGLSPLHEVQLTYLLYRFMEDLSGMAAPAYPLMLEPDYSDIDTLVST